MAKIKHLKDTHPHYKKIDDLFNYMEQNGISVSHGGRGLYITVDGNAYALMDSENPVDEGVGEVPPNLEYKLVIDE